MKKFYAKQCYNKIFVIAVLLYLGSPAVSAQDYNDGFPPNSNTVIKSLNFKNADIRDVLRSVAFEYQTNIMIENQVDTRISTNLFNVDVFSAVKIIAEDNGLEFSYDDKRFFVKLPKEKPLPPPAEPKPEISYRRGNVNLKADNVDIEVLIDSLREITNKNFLIMSGTSGRVTGTLRNIEFDKGLRNLLQNNGFYLTVKDSIYYISRSSYYSSIEATNDLNRNPYWVSAQNGRVTLDVVKADIDKVLSDISNQMGLQIIKLAIPAGNVTIRCSEVPVKKVLSYIFTGTEFSFKEDHGAYIIGNKNSKTLDNTKLVKLQYLRADKVKEDLPQTLMQTVNAGVSLEHNALILTGTNEDISNLENYIIQIDRPVAQVLIEALVVDYNLNNLFQLGVWAGRGDSAKIYNRDKWFPGLNVTAGGEKINKIADDIGSISLFGNNVDIGKVINLPEDFYLNIRALEQRGVANIRSKPLLSTLNGHTASLKIGTVQNYIFTEVVPIVNAVNSTFIEKETFQKIEANISFEITPWVGPNNELTVEIKPDFQTPIGEFSPDKGKIPAINTRSLLSTVRLKDGETIILGGLIQETETNTEEKFPFLGDIPLLGELFTNRDKVKGKSELIIYITPKIYYGDDFGSLYYDYAR